MKLCELCYINSNGSKMNINHDNVIKWKHFPCYWPFVRGIHQSPVDSPHKGQWRRALIFSLICTWTNGWANNRDVGDLRRYCAHYDVTVMMMVMALWRIDDPLYMRDWHLSGLSPNSQGICSSFPFISRITITFNLYPAEDEIGLSTCRDHKWPYYRSTKDRG